VHGLDHALQDRVQQLAGLLGVVVREELHGPLQVGEQYRDLFALSFQGGPGGEDFLGKVARGVAQRCMRTSGQR
jgi:hypothetical protein